MTPERGRLIALEGIDGCGKSTQVRLLAPLLGARLTFEPGDTALGRSLRSILLHGGEASPVPRAEALLMAADRAQHVEEVLLPELAAGRWVVTDRYAGSTVAYQGFGRRLGTDGLAVVVDWATAGLAADLSVLVDVPTEVARARLARAAPDRLEGLDDAFFERVRQGFRAQVEADPDHWVAVDGTADVGAVHEAVVGVVVERLGRPPADRMSTTATDPFERPVLSLFDEVVGQPRAVAALRAAAHHPVHAYLFRGPAGSGAAAAARAFAAAVLCPDGGCGHCETCRRALAGTHPDLVSVERTGRLSRGG